MGLVQHVAQFVKWRYIKHRQNNEIANNGSVNIFSIYAGSQYNKE